MAGEQTDPYVLLSDNNRLAIFHELVQCFIESPLNREVSFTTLLDRTDIEDSGLFNYHLNHLVGTLVTKTDSKYKLTYAGVQIAGNIFSIRTFSFPDDLTRELSRTCPLCSTTLELSYSSGLLAAGCSSCHMLEDIAPPRLVQSHPPDRVADILGISIVANLRQAQRGVCAQCAGHVEWNIRTTTDDLSSSFGAPVVILGMCQTCSAVHVSEPGGYATASAEVMELLSDSLPSFWKDPAGWFIRTHDTTVVSYDLEAQTATVVVRAGGYCLEVAVDHRGVPSELVLDD